MCVVQRLQHAVSVLCVVTHLVDIHLEQCQFVALAVNLFHTVDGGKHARIVLLGPVQTHENVEDIGTLTIV